LNGLRLGTFVKKRDRYPIHIINVVLGLEKSKGGEKKFEVRNSKFEAMSKLEIRKRKLGWILGESGELKAGVRMPRNGRQSGIGLPHSTTSRKE
jgi:hypothetical protein